MTQLPIESVISNIRSALLDRNELVLEAAPGAGKTTRVPLSLLNQPWLENKQIIMLEPRRIAARAAAERMASTLGEPVGETIGYRIRHDNKTGPKTKIIVLTEGVLTRWIQQDPSLAGVALVIFDEFHERNLDSDLGLAFCLQARDIFRDDDPLKLLVMSATLDGQSIAALINNAPILRSEGRSFAVDIQYTGGLNNRKNITDVMSRTILNTLKQRSGNILVFLPGKAEIERVKQNIEARVAKDIVVFPLHGSLKLEQQQAAIEPISGNSDDRRKVVLATDIAETSLTIEGIHTVIDSGLVRIAEYDPRTATTRLNTKRISLASAAQRAGRAGRLGPGCAIRLWSKDEEIQFQKYSTPEILNTDLSAFTLQLFNWGEKEPSALQLLDFPKKGAFDQSVSLLISLGAIEKDKHSQLSLSDHGRAMTQLPVHPRLAHMLIRATELNLKTQAIQVAAILAERDPIKNGDSDFLTRLDLAFSHSNTPSHLVGWKTRVARQEQLLRRVTSSLPIKKNTVLDKHEIDRHDSIAILLAHAFPDRIAHRREQGQKAIYKLSNGRQAALRVNDVQQNIEWLVVAELGGFSESDYDQIYIAHALNKQLFDTHLKALVDTNKSVTWDTQKERFVAEVQYYAGKLKIKKEQLTEVKPNEKHKAILNYVAENNFSILTWSKKSKFLVRRVELVRTHVKSTDAHLWPDFSEQGLINTIDKWLGPFLSQVNRLSDLTKLSVTDMLLAQLSWHQQCELNTLAPEQYKVASGSNVTLDYSEDCPVLAIKLQEMFGCVENPTILNGKMPISIHLLSPAGRPLQITQDLPGFWRGSYHEIKKEMKGRYPKHPWPDDPVNAVATRFTKKRAAESEKPN